MSSARPGLSRELPAISTAAGRPERDRPSIQWRARARTSTPSCVSVKATFLNTGPDEDDSSAIAKTSSAPASCAEQTTVRDNDGETEAPRAPWSTVMLMPEQASWRRRATKSVELAVKTMVWPCVPCGSVTQDARSRAHIARARRNGRQRPRGRLAAAAGRAADAVIAVFYNRVGYTCYAISCQGQARRVLRPSSCPSSRPHYRCSA